MVQPVSIRMKNIVECVPNFSEGRDRTVIDAIVSAIASEEGVRVLNVDIGADANRTVVTFAGESESVAEAAFRGVREASRLIDMRLHHGEHPRIGATDVLPLVPVSGISLEECAALARSLAGRIWTSLGIPCYCYEAAAFIPERRNLAVCRSGEYEGLAAKMADPGRRPDFGGVFDGTAARSGATVVGARDFLVAVNFNLDTTSVEAASRIACEVRQKGRKDASGRWIPGTLKGVKALGWYMDCYGCAQVTMNITDISATSLHRAFEEVSEKAAELGLSVTGTELIGLVPERVILDAGRHILARKGIRAEADASTLIAAAVSGLKLNVPRPFDPQEKILEYRLLPVFAGDLVAPGD